ncbi:MAG: PQQ-binding-like beta-propeller repeat protein [Pseudomonadota bacterium]
MKNKLTAMLCVMALIFSGAAVCAESWHTFKGNAQRSETVSKDFPTELAVLWQHLIPTKVTSSPAVVDEQLLIGGLDGVLYAFDLETHTINWTLATRGSIRATPTVDKSHGYVLSEDGFFYAFDLETGRVQWRFETLGEQRFAAYGYNGMKENKPVVDPWDYLSSSALVTDDLVVFGSGDSHIYALNKATGDRVWSFKTGGVVHSSPALWEDYVIVGSWDSNVYALDLASGKLVWKYQTESEQEYSLWTGVQASPTIFDDKVYIGSRDGFLYSLEAKTGERLWRYDMAKSWVVTTVAVDQDQVYVGSSDTGLAIAVNRKDGTENWRYKTKGWNYSSPLLFNDSVLFSSMLGKVVALNKADGATIWKQELGAYRQDTYGVLNKDTNFNDLYDMMSRILASGGFMATPIWAKNRLIMVSNAGEIYFWQPG